VCREAMMLVLLLMGLCRSGRSAEVKSTTAKLDLIFVDICKALKTALDAT
jgi:hypothetical protein